MLTEYQRECQRRWPRAVIHGDGPAAFVSTCTPNGGVWLYRTELEAECHRIRCADSCGHAHCYPRNHRVLMIEPVTAPRVAFELGYD